MANTMDAVNNIFDQDYNDLKNNVSDILYSKLQDRIGIEKITVGQSMFQDDYELEDGEVAQQDDADYEPETDYNNEDNSDEEV